MIFICNANNEIASLFANNIHQGELNANHILLLAPYPEDAIITMRVKLGNGIVIPAEPNYYFFKSAEIPAGLPLKLDTAALNAWSIRLDAAVTQYAGSVEFQIFATLPLGTADKPIKYATSTVVEVIGRGVPQVGTAPDWSEVNTEEVYQAAINAEVSANEAAESARAAAAALEAAAAALPEIEILAEEVQINSDYVRENVGDLQSAFDELHTYAQTIINGGTLQ